MIIGFPGESIKIYLFPKPTFPNNILDNNLIDFVIPSIVTQDKNLMLTNLPSLEEVQHVVSLWLMELLALMALVATSLKNIVT